MAAYYYNELFYHLLNLVSMMEDLGCFYIRIILLIIGNRFIECLLYTDTLNKFM